MQPVSAQPARVQPAEPRRLRGRPRKVRVDANPEEHDNMVNVGNNVYNEDIDEEDNAEDCELSVVPFVEQDEDDNVNHNDYYGEVPADAGFEIDIGVDGDMNAVHDDGQEDDLTLVVTVKMMLCSMNGRKSA